MRLVLPLVVIVGFIFLVNPVDQLAFANTSSSHPFQTTWGESGLTKPGKFTFPQNIAIDDEGNVYVTDLGNMRVQKFKNDGTFLLSWGSQGSGSGQFKAPVGIAIYEDSVFVVDNQLNRIQKFNLDGEFISKWGEEGQDPGQFLLPNEIDVGTNGTLYVVDTGNQRIQKFTQNGQYISEFGESGMEDGKFLNVKGIAVDKNENIFVSDPGKNKIFKFNSQGEYTQSYGPLFGGLSMKPHGMAIDPEGNIYAVDYMQDRIVQFDSQGQMLTSWGSMGIANGQFKLPTDIDIDNNGFVFVVDSNGHRIQKFGSPFVTEYAPVQSEPDSVSTASTEQTASQTQQITEPVFNPVPGDLTKPTITPPNDLFIEATGGLTPVSVGQAMATDESGIQSLTSNAPANFPLGVTTIIWTAIDGAGNMGIATQTVTVVDTVPPIISQVDDITIQATPSGQNSAQLSIPNTFDAVGVISVTNDAPQNFPIGTTLITWTATDVAGNIATTTQSVNVVDTYPPVIYVPEDVVMEATSNNQNQVYLGEASVVDNGEVISITNDAPQFFEIGNTTVTWVASDDSGNTATKNQLVSVIDTTAPHLIIPDDITVEATSENANLIYLDEPIVSDVQNVTITNDAPALFTIGETIVNWVATDPSGNFASGSQTVHVVDTTAPIIESLDNIVIEATGIENNNVTLGNLTAEDATGILSITNDSPDLFPLGTTIVTWNVTDNYGNYNTYEQTINVIDTTAPTITASADVVIEATSVDENVVNLISPVVDDLVSIESISNDAPQFFPIGMTTVTWTATDTSGNSASDTQTVTVSDTTPPSIIAPVDIVVEATSSSGMPVAIGQPQVSDEIGIDSISNNSPQLFNLGNTTVVWSATDLHGNTAMANQTISVVDTTAPSIIAPDDIVSEAQNPDSNIVSIGLAQADDAVGVASLENNAPPVFALGDTSVVWTATDESGNIATAIQTISIIDSTAPSIIAPDDVTVEATGLETLAILGNASATDSIGIDSVTNDAPERYPLGETLVTWTATDLGGLTSTDTQIVRVIDTTPPTIRTPKTITVEAASMNDNIVDYGTISADDLVEVTSVINDAPAVFPFGLTTITWTVSDAAGNTATAEQQVSVIDTTAPIINPPQDIVIEATAADTIIELISAEATDEVSVISITNNAPTTFQLGNTTVIWFAEDSSGNISNATQIISVIDTLPPNIIQPDELVVEATSSNTAISLENPIATDSVSQVTITNDSPAEFGLGDTFVTWIATDEAGNSASVSQKITVVDTTAPELSLPDNITINAISLQTPVLVGNANATDLTDSQPSVTNNAPSTFPLGETIVTWIATDEFGNSASATQVVNVQACGREESYFNKIMGTINDDILEGTNAADLIFALEGDDIIMGMKGNDCIFGGDGDDIIYGNEGSDYLYGSEGSDVLKGQSGEDIISGGTGIDVIDGGDEIDSCNVNESPDGDLIVKCEN